MYVIESEDIFGSTAALFNILGKMCFINAVILPVFGSQRALTVFVTYQ
jgi:hypothetical protein